MIDNSYGKELILDLHHCDSSMFTRDSLKKYFKKLCELIDMERGPLYFWDYKDDPEEYEKAEDHLKGTSAIQFIMTSNITIHTLDILREVYLNIFSCKDFSSHVVEEFSEKFFKGKVKSKFVFKRG